MHTRLCLVILIMVSLTGTVLAAEVATHGPITVAVPEGWQAEVINEKETAGHIDLKSDNAVIHVYTYERSNPNLQEAMKDMVVYYSKKGGSQYEIYQFVSSGLMAAATTRGKNFWPDLATISCGGQIFYISLNYVNGIEPELTQAEHPQSAFNMVSFSLRSHVPRC